MKLAVSSEGMAECVVGPGGVFPKLRDESLLGVMFAGPLMEGAWLCATDAAWEGAWDCATEAAWEGAWVFATDIA